MDGMRLAFSSLGCPDYSFEQMVSACVAYGYKGVSIRTALGTTDLLSLREFSADVPISRRRLSDNGIELLCVSTGVRFTSESGQERAAAADEARRYIDLAAALSSRHVRLFGGPITPEMDRERTVDNIVTGFRESAEYAQPRDVLVLLETHDTFATGRSARRLLDQINHPSVGVIWDILHSYRCGEGFEATVQAIGGDIKNVHLKDSADFDEEHFDLRLCGEGHLPIGEALEVLDSNGYEGYYEFEWEKGWHPELEPPEVALPHFVDYITRLRRDLDHHQGAKSS